MSVPRSWLRGLMCNANESRSRLRGFFERLRRSLGRPRAVVTFDDIGVVCRRPHGLEESVGWDELERVEILTTDCGPICRRRLLGSPWS